MSVIDEVKSKLDIITYIQQFVPLKKAGRHYKACCPFHAERTPSFVVNPDTQSWRCFGACAEGGDVFGFAMKFHGWSFGEALRELGKSVGVEVERQTPQQQQRSERLDTLRGILNTLAEEYHRFLIEAKDPDAAAALKYTREKRGFSDDTVRGFKIGYAPPGWQNALNLLKQLGYREDDIIESGIATRNEQGRVYDRFRHRLMIPIRDDRGRVVGFGARALDADDTPKYLNSPQTPLFDKSRLLFGLDAARRSIRDSKTAVIVEGYMDAIQAHQAGYTNVVAQMGTALTETQLKLLVPALAEKIILALDADAAGQNATRRSLEVARQTLREGYSGRLSVDMRVLQIPDAKDPDDLLRETPERWQGLVAAALPITDYVIEQETAALPPQATVQEREGVARRLLPLLLASENNLYTKENLQKLSVKLRITERDLLAWAQEQEKISAVKAPRAAPAADSGPDFPPLNYDALDAPPPTDDDLAPLKIAPAAPGRAAAPVRPAAARREVALEASCLRMLLRDPDLLYQVNRKFRELAGNQARLLAGPLCDLNMEDFSHSAYRVLMRLLTDAFQQHDLEPLHYVEVHMEDVLWPEVETLLVDEIDGLRPRLRHGLLLDLAAQLKRAEISAYDEAVEKALRLRKERLARQIDDIFFLKLEGGDAPQQQEMLMLYLKARGLIEVELQHATMNR
ncbi:MAG: DNA primase [Chloroflexi bacterium]|nr:DNA primase [Chloroflexota bacterium]